MSCRGFGKHQKSWISVASVIAEINCTPRNAWKAATSGARDHCRSRSRSACSSRAARAPASLMVCRYSWKATCSGGSGSLTVANHRTCPGVHAARPAYVMPLRSNSALRRCRALRCSRTASSRARTTSRNASSAVSVTRTGLTSPARASRASQRIAPIRSYPLALWSRNRGRGNHIVLPPDRSEVPRQHETARTGFVDDVQAPSGADLPAQGLGDGLAAACNGGQVAHLGPARPRTRRCRCCLCERPVRPTK